MAWYAFGTTHAALSGNLSNNGKAPNAVANAAALPHVKYQSEPPYTTGSKKLRKR